MDKEEMKTKLKKKKKELMINILFCGFLGVVAGVVLGNIVNSYLLSIGGTILIAEGLGLTVNVSLIKEIKHIKVNLTQGTTEVETSEEQEETTKLEKNIQEEHQEKEEFILETPISQMTLYGYENVFYPIYFDLEEKQKFIEEDNTPMQLLHSIEFIGDFAGRKNVVRIYNQSNILDSKEYYVAMKEKGYVLLNEERSIQNGSYIWETCERCIGKIDVQYVYYELQKRGIVLEGKVTKFRIGGIHPFDGYRSDPIWKQPENDAIYYDEVLDNQVRVPSKSIEELQEELEKELNSKPKETCEKGEITLKLKNSEKNKKF